MKKKNSGSKGLKKIENLQICLTLYAPVWRIRYVLPKWQKKSGSKGLIKYKGLPIHVQKGNKIAPASS